MISLRAQLHSGPCVSLIRRLLLLLLLLSCFSHVRLCATPQTAAQQAPPSLGFSRQEYWSGMPSPSLCQGLGSSKFPKDVKELGLGNLNFLHWGFLISSIVRVENGNPLQCSCLENPRDGGAWWAAVCGVAQSRT